MSNHEPDLIDIDTLQKLLVESQNRGMLIVDSFFADSDILQQWAAAFNLQIYVHIGEPKEADVDKMAEAVRLSDHGPVVAVGGGAVMDAAKAAASIAAGDLVASHYQLGANELPMSRGLVVCVPTTNGTGSEVTRTSIISDADGNKKWMYGDALWPDHVLLLPELVHSVPPRVKVFCGLDAMVHALEAASSRNSSAEVVARAAQSIPIILDVLADSVAGDPEADRQMQLASLQAGRAIDLGGTTIGHCLGHALGSVCQIPHGKAVSLATQMTLETCVRQTPHAFAAIERAADRGSILDCWQGLVDRVGNDDFVFAGAASVDEILQSVLSDENQPMRAANVHWFDDQALAAVIQALLDQYQVREAD